MRELAGLAALVQAKHGPNKRAVLHLLLHLPAGVKLDTVRPFVTYELPVVGKVACYVKRQVLCVSFAFQSLLLYEVVLACLA